MEVVSQGEDRESSWRTWGRQKGGGEECEEDRETLAAPAASPSAETLSRAEDGDGRLPGLKCGAAASEQAWKDPSWLVRAWRDSKEDVRLRLRRDMSRSKTDVHFLTESEPNKEAAAACRSA